MSGYRPLTTHVERLTRRIHLCQPHYIYIYINHHKTREATDDTRQHNYDSTIMHTSQIQQGCKCSTVV